MYLTKIKDLPGECGHLGTLGQHPIFTGDIFFDSDYC